MVVVLQVLLLLVSMFLVLIILLQRGRGGGLAGAFGGLGGQSAFGTKAGDVFTWLTVATATVWVLLAGVGGCVMRHADDTYGRTMFTTDAPDDAATEPDDPGMRGEGPTGPLFEDPEFPVDEPGESSPVIPDLPDGDAAAPESTPETTPDASPDATPDDSDSADSSDESTDEDN